MGKYRSKLKGQTKGKRWPKGQSSSSNPVSKKYRNSAKSKFFQPLTESAPLTIDALRKHDIHSTYQSQSISSEPTEIDDAVSETVSYKSGQTFASDWSECTNVSFSRLMHIFKPSSALHKEMLAILAAVTDVIKQNNGNESSTEYYAALMTTLEATETEITLAAVLSLLNMGIKSVPVSVLRLQFSHSSKIYFDLLEKFAESDNVAIIKSLIGLLANLLRVQECASWSNLSTVKMFKSLLTFICYSKPKVRKAAHQGVCAILLANNNETDNKLTFHPAAVHVAQFCKEQIETSTVAQTQITILHNLSLIKDIIHKFPKSEIKNTCELILKLMMLNDPLVTCNGMQVLYNLFSSQTAVIPASLNGQLINALYEYQPSITDIQPTLAWVTVMQQAHVHLADVDLLMASQSLPKITSTLTQLWLSDRNEIINSTSNALHIILIDCVQPICMTTEKNQIIENNLQKCFAIIESCLAYQYSNVWHHVLHIIATVFKIGGKNYHYLLTSTLKQLAELRDSYKFSFNNELEYAVGAAVKSMGPEIVLQIISLTNQQNEVILDRSWLILVLKENVECSSLMYFKQSIIPLAMRCHERSLQLSSVKSGVEAHSYELLYLQLWDLLSSFCRYPKDIKVTFRQIAKLLGIILSKRKELRLIVLTSLRRLIQSTKETENSDDKNELGNFAKNFLPILFNLYTKKPNGTDEEGQRLAVLETIKDYLTVSSEEHSRTLFSTALNQLKENEELDQYIKQSLLDILKILIPYQTKETLEEFYEANIKNFLNIKNKKEQKKAYRLLEKICSCESVHCKEFLQENKKKVQHLLMKTLSSTAVSSRTARLKCHIYLVKALSNFHYNSKFLKSIIPEAVLSLKDINTKCRETANKLIISIGELLEKQGEIPEYLALILLGLIGTNEMISASILAITVIIYNFASAIGVENLKQVLGTICELMTSSIREIVASCLVFIKIFLSSLPTPIIASYIPNIVKSLTNMKEDCSKHYRLRVRDILCKLIRKFGYESVSQQILPTNVIMYKRLRNLRKLLVRKKKIKEAVKNYENEGSDDDIFSIKTKQRIMEEILADSDSDFEDMEIDEVSKSNKKTKMNTWINEDVDDIIDFTDPSAIGKITATKPGQKPEPMFVKPKKKDRGFKMSSDNKLIIETNSDDSDDDKKTKIKFLSLGSDSDSENDHKSAAETAIIGNRKRKRADTVSNYSGVSSISPIKYQAGGSGIHRNLQIGAEYRSKKAAGDVKKKGKLDPYAYLPLKRTNLNKRKRAKNSAQFKNIIQAANKGARKGMKSGKLKKKQ